MRAFMEAELLYPAGRKASPHGEKYNKPREGRTQNEFKSYANAELTQKTYKRGRYDIAFWLFFPSFSHINFVTPLQGGTEDSKFTTFPLSQESPTNRRENPLKNHTTGPSIFLLPSQISSSQQQQKKLFFSFPFSSSLLLSGFYDKCT